jgi:hypothetical protein
MAMGGRAKQAARGVVSGNRAMSAHEVTSGGGEGRGLLFPPRRRIVFELTLLRRFRKLPPPSKHAGKHPRPTRCAFPNEWGWWWWGGGGGEKNEAKKGAGW